MKDSPFFYFIFAILYWISIKCLESSNSIIVGLGFLFAVNILFTAYFGITQIVNGYSLADDFLVQLGKAAIMINGIFLMLSLTCALVMIYNINEKWKQSKGTSLQLSPYYQNNMDMFINSVINNIYFEGIIIGFIVIFKNYFNNVYQLDKTNATDAYGYVEKAIKYVWAGLVSIFYINTYSQARSYHVLLENWFPTSYESFKNASVFIYILQGFLYVMYYILWIPMLILLCILAFIKTIFTKIVPSIYEHGFRYAYVTSVPILSMVIISYSIYQLYLAGSFTKLERQNIIT